MWGAGTHGWVLAVRALRVGAADSVRLILYTTSLSRVRFLHGAVAQTRNHPKNHGADDDDKKRADRGWRPARLTRANAGGVDLPSVAGVMRTCQRPPRNPRTTPARSFHVSVSLPFRFRSFSEHPSFSFDSRHTRPRDHRHALCIRACVRSRLAAASPVRSFPATRPPTPCAAHAPSAS